MTDKVDNQKEKTTSAVEVDSKVESEATKEQSQVNAEKVETKVEDQKGTEQPESKKEEESKQVEKGSEENGEEPENKTYSRKMTKAELIAELDDMKEDMETMTAKLNEKEATYNQLKAEVEKYKNQIQEMEQSSEKYNKLVSEIVEAKKNSLPKEIQDLIPDGTLEVQLAWLNKAEQSGLGTPKKEKPNVEIGKPMNMGSNQADTSKMTPQQKLSSYFAQVFTK